MQQTLSLVFNCPLVCCCRGSPERMNRSGVVDLPRLVICPESKTCDQIGCRHRVLHQFTDSCSKLERGNIINGCKTPCGRRRED